MLYDLAVLWNGGFVAQKIRIFFFGKSKDRDGGVKAEGTLVCLLVISSGRNVVWGNKQERCDLVAFRGVGCAYNRSLERWGREYFSPSNNSRTICHDQEGERG